MPACFVCPLQLVLLCYYASVATALPFSGTAARGVLIVQVVELKPQFPVSCVHACLPLLRHSCSTQRNPCLQPLMCPQLVLLRYYASVATTLPFIAATHAMRAL
eukprot:TRINITY_DN361_c0_g1_i4.p1 TRINITY_DN361_c0_g1~~TRINITY_DN361_c0_g1_i4.p1  ORF type:complete len:104 (+),score=24.04 TRINITY_DN361_c0_g1_i4:634-945(+)